MNIEPGSDGKKIADIEFGKCIVKQAQRRLLRDGSPVDLGDREFELLLMLIQAYGKLVSKDELIARVWPGRIVEENTLEGRISFLRRALGADRSAIKTISGRGYQFVASLHTPMVIGADALPAPFHLLPANGPTPGNGNRLPSSVSQLIGRDIALNELVELARTNRLITLVGTGGIGKTRLAIESARTLTSGFRDGVFLAELGSVVSADFVPTTVGAALGFPPGDGKAALERIAALIFAKKLLLVLDNCEHLIEAAAQLAERLLRASPDISIIATSREALRIEGEYVYRVTSLDVPDFDGNSTDRSLGSGALQLFQARLSPGTAHQTNDNQLPLQARICRRLDGIPLALELAAARVAVLGLQGVADRLDDRFRLLTNGARTALPRQQTLRATLDWSYELLLPEERTVLAQLSIFAGNFTLESAKAVVSTPELPADAIAAHIADLVEKSLISVKSEGEILRFRLLETTRVYAREKLLGTGNVTELSLAHARHYTTLFEECEREARQGFASEWRTGYAGHLEDFRSAVAWCFGNEGAPDIGVRLTLAGMPLSLQLGLLEECIARVGMALAWLDCNDMDAHAWRMKLHAARGTALLYLTFARDSITGEAFRQTLELADYLGDAGYQKYAVWGYWCCSYLNGHYQQSLELAQRFRLLAIDSDQPWDALVGDRISGTSHLCLGQLDESRRALERMLTDQPLPVSRTHRVRYLYDEKTLARATLAHTLHQQGFPDQAKSMATQAQADANELAHVPSLCYALSEGISTMALLAGDSKTLGHAIALLDNTTRLHGVSTWKARSRMWGALAPLQQGYTEAYDRVVVPALADIGIARFFISVTPLLSTIALLLGEHGRANDGIVLTREGIERASKSGDACSFVEFSRVESQLLLLRDGPPSEDLVEQQLLSAMDIAHRNGFLSWELRCVIDLTRLWLLRKNCRATDVLRSVYDRFTEGWDSTDLRSARELLDKDNS